MDYAKELKKYRIEHDLDQKSMAERLGVTCRAYQYWESGRIVNERNAFKIQKLLKNA